ILISPQLAKVALSFGPPEYFALALFGITIVAGVSGDSLLKGVIAGLMGLFIATIGMDPITGTTRFTFDIPELLNGVDVIPALVGLFAISEILTRLEKKGENIVDTIKTSTVSLKASEVSRNWFNLLRSSSIGTFIGI